MSKIKFGTDGWRAIIAQDYTVANVKRVAQATALWIAQNKGTAVVIGHDCRFAGELFAQNTAQIIAAHGIKVYLAKGFVSTPMVSLAVVKTHSYLGVVITASHNPPDYNGFKLKSQFGSPCVQADIDAVENLIPDNTPDIELESIAVLLSKGLLEYIDLEEMYYQEVQQKFDIPAILNSDIRLAYDAMYGAGQAIVKRILPNIIPLHCEHNPHFYGQAPEPIHRNLLALSKLIQDDNSINCGLANDGDADRIGMYDENGNFVDSHQILLLLIHYLYKYKNLTGKVAITFSVTDKVKKLCTLYNLPFVVLPIGFKYIAEVMLVENVLVGGEESGGICAAGHIPERDGVWMGLLLLELMCKTGLKLSQLMQNIYDLVGTFAFDRYDLHLDNGLKNQIIDNCKSGLYTSLADYAVLRTETIDGYKFYIAEDTWVMIRPSGTEPLLRVYCEAPTLTDVHRILDKVKLFLLKP
jgi:phosphomannomutase